MTGDRLAEQPLAAQTALDHVLAADAALVELAGKDIVTTMRVLLADIATRLVRYYGAVRPEESP